MFKNTQIKVINKSKHMTTENNILVKDGTIFDQDLKCEEIAVYLTLLTFADDDIITNKHLYECFSEPKTEIDKIMSELLSNDPVIRDDMNIFSIEHELIPLLSDGDIEFINTMINFLVFQKNSKKK